MNKEKEKYPSSPIFNVMNSNIADKSQGISFVFEYYQTKYDTDFPLSLKELYELVKEWHKLFRIPVLDMPTSDIGIRKDLRMSLIKEEAVKEYMEAKDIVAIVDSIVDSLVVLFGTAIEHGIGFGLLQHAFIEVMKSNFTKLDENANPIFAPSGKVLKSNLYKKPELVNIIKKHGGA